QAGQQQAHARDVAVVFAGLVGAAEKYFVDLPGIQPRVTRQQRLQRHRAEVVGTDAGERAAVAADRGADAIDNEYVAHHSAPSCLPWAASVRACSARSVSSSAACGTGVSTTWSANLIGQPVASMICSRVMPGWIDTTASSRVTRSGSITHRSVTTTCGPLPGRPARWRASPPSMWPTLVTKSSLLTKARFDWRMMMNTSFAEPAISGAPPAPGRRVFGASEVPITVGWRLAKRAICAARRER